MGGVGTDTGCAGCRWVEISAYYDNVNTQSRQQDEDEQAPAGIQTTGRYKQMQETKESSSKKGRLRPLGKQDIVLKIYTEVSLEPALSAMRNPGWFRRSVSCRDKT